jgi:two-component system, NtrC family, sensor kinase
MSSLGQLVAGIAHEINNPVNFIYGNLSHADTYAADLLDLIALYQEHYPEPHPAIRDRSEDIDLPFLIDDLPKILTSMRIGADRIRQIVLSLRNFSRIDEADMKAVDIHEGIDSTLLILQSRLKPQENRPPVKIVREYSTLPPVECFPGQLNQVFMNLIANAIDALESVSDPNVSSTLYQPQPQISIRTQVNSSDTVSICIADNGPGMSPQVQTQLFNPFFTTKPVGKGTGLGLSISYQIIVEKHGGSLRCVSEVGTGTEFWIEIPVHQPEMV